MLSRLASQAVRRNAIRSRGLCTEVPLVTQVKETIADAHAKLSSKQPEVYPIADFKKDLENGTVDSALLSKAMSFDEEAKKVAAKIVGKLNAFKNTPPAKEIDFGAWESKLSSPTAAAEVKAVYDQWVAESANNAALEDAYNTDLANIKSGFQELYKSAAAQEKAAAAGILDSITQLELLENQVANVKEQTIAEILEAEPELRAELEEEIKNNVWAP